MRRLLMLAAVLLTTGCGPSLPANPTTYPVHGKVTVGGKAATDGDIMFEPAPGNPDLNPARGTIGSDGAYSASTFIGQDGMVPGEYVVLFAPGPTTKFPEKYVKQEHAQDLSDSPLKFTVKAEDNTIDVKVE